MDIFPAGHRPFSVRNNNRLLAKWLLVLGCTFGWAASGASLPAADVAPTAAQVASILVERCVACHGPQKQAGGYRLDSFAKARTPGDSAAQPIVDKSPEASELYRRLVTSNADERMPAEAAPLPAREIALVKAWIAEGAMLSPELEARPLTAWSRSTAKPTTPEQYPATLPITAVALVSVKDSPEPEVSLWTSGYGEALQWRVSPADAQLQRRVPVAGSHVSDIDVSTSGKWMAVASGTPGSQGFVELFDLSRAQPVATWVHASADVPADMAIAPDDRHLAVGQGDGTLIIVDTSYPALQPASVQSLAPHADAILAVNWSTNADRLITGSRDRTAKIFEANQWQLIANYDRHERAVGGVAYLKEKPVSLDETGTLRLWSGDDSDRTVAERGNLARFLEPVVALDQQVWLAMGSELHGFQVERKTVEDGKDDQGKPKQKTTTRWKPDQQLSSGQAGWLLSLDGMQNWLVAGSDSGEVIVWRAAEKLPWHRFVAKPD